MNARVVPFTEGTAPQYVQPDFDRMPDELKQQNKWILWVPVLKGTKWTKRPTQISGFAASTTNPKHWSSFEDVRGAYDHAIELGYVELKEKNKPPQRLNIGGVGFVLDGCPDPDGFVLAGVDFDNVISSKMRLRLWHRSESDDLAHTMNSAFPAPDCM